MAETVELSDLKTMLGLTTSNSDDVLNLIINNTMQALRFKLGLNASDAFPSELDWVALEVCVRRFNRLKNEGMSSYSQEGESITFQSDDFNDFQKDIDEWKANNNSKHVKPKAQFINPFRR